MKQLIEQRFKNTRPPDDLVGSALRRLPDGVSEIWFKQTLTEAAVLVPLIERGEALTVLLTQRTDHLDDHPGQISFPGGRCEPSDAGALHTALREAQEEIGLTASSVSVIGYLEPLAVVTGFAVAPVVGFVAGNTTFTPDPFEVADVFEVPLDFFLDEANRRQTERNIHGTLLPFSEYQFEGRRIWGATAMIIHDLTKLINN